jgi:hypothetical protein
LAKAGPGVNTAHQKLDFRRCPGASNGLHEFAVQFVVQRDDPFADGAFIWQWDSETPEERSSSERAICSAPLEYSGK